MVELGQPVVGRDRHAHHVARGLGQFGRGLLAEQPERLGGLFQRLPGSRVGIGHQPREQAHHDRVHARLEERHPGREPDQEVPRPEPDAAPPHHQDHAKKGDPEHQRHHADMTAVHQRDDDQPGQVVDHGEGEQVGADPVRQPAADQGQRAEREGGVGRHGHAPAVLGGQAGVDDQVDAGRHGHPGQPDQHRQGEPAAYPQLAHVELASRLQPDNEEVQGHQPGVHELTQVEPHARAADGDGQMGGPEPVVGRDADVRPDQRRYGGGGQHRGAARLGAQERAQRRLLPPHPGRRPGETTSGRLLDGLAVAGLHGRRCLEVGLVRLDDSRGPRCPRCPRCL